MKTRIFKTVRKVLISAIVLALLFVAGGVAYVRLADQHPKPQPKVVAVDNTKARTIPKLPKPDPSAPVGVSEQSLISPVSPGSNTSMTVHTTPGARCTIVFKYNNITSTDSGLAPQTADAYGQATWTWTVGKDVPAGTWPVTVTCQYLKHNGVVIGNLQVNTGGLVQ